MLFYIQDPVPYIKDIYLENIDILHTGASTEYKRNVLEKIAFYILGPVPYIKEMIWKNAILHTRASTIYQRNVSIKIVILHRGTSNID